MPYQVAGIDVHKKMLAVVVADVEVDDDYRFERLKVGTSPAELRALADWLVEREVEEVVMESTAQHWRPVWEALELHWRPQRRNRDGASPLSGTLHLFASFSKAREPPERRLPCECWSFGSFPPSYDRRHARRGTGCGSRWASPKFQLAAALSRNP